MGIPCLRRIYQGCCPIQLHINRNVGEAVGLKVVRDKIEMRK